MVPVAVVGEVVMVPVAEGTVPVDVTVKVGEAVAVPVDVPVPAPVMMIGITGWLLLLNRFLNVRNFLRKSLPLDGSLATWAAPAPAAAPDARLAS